MFPLFFLFTYILICIEIWLKHDRARHFPDADADADATLFQLFQTQQLAGSANACNRPLDASNSSTGKSNRSIGGRKFSFYCSFIVVESASYPSKVCQKKNNTNTNQTINNWKGVFGKKGKWESLRGKQKVTITDLLRRRQWLFLFAFAPPPPASVSVRLERQLKRPRFQQQQQQPKNNPSLGWIFLVPIKFLPWNKKTSSSSQLACNFSARTTCEPGLDWTRAFVTGLSSLYVILFYFILFYFIFGSLFFFSFFLLDKVRRFVRLEKLMREQEHENTNMWCHRYLSTTTKNGHDTPSWTFRNAAAPLSALCANEGKQKKKKRKKEAIIRNCERALVMTN